MSVPLSDTELAEIEFRFLRARDTGELSMSQTDVGVLLDEVKRLRAVVDDHGREAVQYEADYDRLRAEAAKEERAHLATIGERDYAQSMADKLAAAIAPEDVLGEHSDGNFPWQNALDWAPEKERAFGEQQAEVDRLRADLGRIQRWASTTVHGSAAAEVLLLIRNLPAAPSV